MGRYVEGSIKELQLQVVLPCLYNVGEISNEVVHSAHSCKLATRGLPRLVLEILNCLSDTSFRYTDRASGPLTAVKHVRDVVNF